MDLSQALHGKETALSAESVEWFKNFVMPTTLIGPVAEVRLRIIYEQTADQNQKNPW